MEEKKNYKYDAFISYRHCKLDKFVAENLHKMLETYQLPKNVKKKLGITGKTYRRIFKDREELPLTSNLEDPIIEGLKESKYLIVICSPRLKDSLWCKKEIETFKKLRGRKNIFCVLIEGEPSESFPEEVLSDEEIVVKNGKKVKEKILVEPLAADVRADSKKKIIKKIKEEQLRLIAPMYNLDYDDLKQRHKQREQKRIITTLSSIAIGSILFTIYSLAMFIKIQLQQNVLAEHHALSLVDKASQYLKEDDRYNAIKLSYEALTDFENIKMPYTPDAEYQLVESLGIYDAGSSYKAVSQIKTKGVVDSLKVTKNRKYGATYDESETITLFNTKSLKKIGTYVTTDITEEENSFTFVGNDILAYINEKGNISLINVKNGKEIKEIEKDKNEYTGIQGDSNGKYLAYVSRKKLAIYDVENKKEIDDIKTSDKFVKKIYFSEDSKYIFALTTEDSMNPLESNKSLTLHVVGVNGKEINNKHFDAESISGIITKDNNAYMLLNTGLGDSLKMLVVSYNFIDDHTNWSKTYDGKFGSFITRSYLEGVNNITVATNNTVGVLDQNNGDLIETFNTNSQIINLYSYIEENMYLALLSSGSVNYLNMDNRKNIEVMDRYEFNLDDYSDAAATEKGFLLVPTHENRVILYESKSNKEVKEKDIKLDYIKDDSYDVKDVDKLIEKYNMKNKNLIEKVFYDTKKELIFVNYANKDVAIYDVKTKKLLKELENVGTVNHYFGKDKYNRIYIGDSSDAYILDGDYNKVGHIKGLAKLDNDKVIISSNKKYYVLKIYTLNDLKKEAKTYLN